jgi:hypothetical protein
MPPRTRTALAVLTVAALAHALPEGLVTFNDGTEGWSGPQGIGGVGTFIDENEGDPAPGLHTIFNDFGITFRNSTNPAFVRDLSQVAGFSFAIDTKVNDIAFFGTPAPRPWLLELRDFDAGPGNNQFASVWFKFADISAATHTDWTRFFVQVAESDYAGMPAGWRGAGAEDPVTFEPMLPEGISFADVIAGYDEIVITTLEPGFFFGFTDFDVVVDDINLATNTDIVSCNPADLAEPFGVTDLADLQCFVFSFVNGQELADFAAPFGVLDLADVQAFIQAFLNGCP